MARTSAEDIERRLKAKNEPVAASKAEPPPPAPEPRRPLSRKEQLSRQGLSFTGYYINEKARKQLRTLAFKEERDKQDLFREAMNLLFEKYDMDPVHYE